MSRSLSFAFFVSASRVASRRQRRKKVSPETKRRWQKMRRSRKEAGRRHLIDAGCFAGVYEEIW